MTPNNSNELTVRQSIRRTNLRGEPMTPYYDEIAIDKSDAGCTRTRS